MMAREVERAIGHIPIHQINSIQLAGIVLGWKNRLARNTAYSLRSRLKKFLRDTEQLGAPHRLDEQLPTLKFPRARTIIATPQEIAALHRHAEPWMQLYLHLCGQLGLRFSEAYSIAEQHWNQEAHTITFTKKGGDPHTLPTTEEIERLFRLAPEGPPDKPYFARLMGRGHTKTGVLSKTALREAWHRLKLRAGVNPALIIHDLRRTVAVTAYALTKDIVSVSHLLGHANISTTSWYLQHRDPAQLSMLTQLLRTPKGPVQ